MCVCVCVCVCVYVCVFNTDSFQTGFPNRSCCASCTCTFFGIFDVSQRTCSQNQCLVPLPLLVPLGVSKRIMLPLPLSACFLFSSSRLSACFLFFSSRLDLCTATLSNTASLPVSRFGAEHCREYVRAKSKHQEVLTRSIKKQRLLAVLMRTLVFVSD